MKIIELVVALVVVAFAALGLVEASGFPRASSYLPTAVLGLTCLLGLAWAAQSVLALRREPPTIRVDRTEARRLITLAVLAPLYVLAIEQIGFFTSTFVFLPLAGFALGYTSLRGLAVSTLAFMALLYAVFGLLLRTPLPPERLFQLLGINA